VAAVLVLAVLATALLVWQRPWHDDSATADDVVSFPDDASTQLTAQLRALGEATSLDDVVTAMGESAASRALARRTWTSLQAVAAPGASWRYISGGEVADRSDGSATAVAEVSWRPSAQSGLDPSVTHRSTVELRVAPERDGTFSVIDVDRSSGGVPIWLLGAVTVDSADGRVVLRIDGGDPTLAVDDLATTARRGVERVVPAADGGLTIVSPRTEAQMADVLGQDESAVSQIAAVTTGIDGDASTQDAVVVLNPDVFATMDRRAAQVVLTHEATHVLTNAIGTSAVNWVVEGFADYVALHDDTAPLSISAGQVLAEVKAGRSPEQLPTDADFGSTRHGLGAVYESAWMVFRLLAEGHSDEQIVSFYRSVLDGSPVEKALAASFGLTVDQLTDRWRDYLMKSASTVS
jgi:hypothetical protein